MARKKSMHQALGRRERQIMDVVYQLQEASVGDVLERLPDPPSYSAVRTMLRLLEQKGYLKHRQEGVRFIYAPTQPREKAGRSALKHLLDTFFAGSATDAVAAILDNSADELSPEDLDRLARLIENARKEGR